MKSIQFSYKNHRGEIALRTVTPDAIEFFCDGSPEYNHQPGWFISGFDHDKQARRSFALKDILLQGPNFFGGMHPFYKLRLEDSK